MRHEPVIYAFKDTAKHKFYGDRKQTTVWEFDKPTKSKLHPTTKPLPLIAYPMRMSSMENSIVLDLFGGSGSTLMAAEQLNRIAYMMSQNNLLTKLTQETSERQLASVIGTTAGVIHTVIEGNMDRLTEEKAVATDRLFRDRALGVQLVADFAEKLLSDPDSVPRAAWQKPDASHDGELFVKALFAEGLEEAAVADRLGVIANMTDLMLCLEYKGPQARQRG